MCLEVKKLVSKFAFKFNLRRYTEEKLSKVTVRTAEVDAMQQQLHELHTALYQPATP